MPHDFLWETAWPALWVAANTAKEPPALPQSSRPCGFSRANLTLVLRPHLFHMQLNELHDMLFVLRKVYGWCGGGNGWYLLHRSFADAGGKSLVQPLPRLTVYGAPELPASLHHCLHHHCLHHHCHHRQQCTTPCPVQPHHLAPSRLARHSPSQQLPQ